MIAALAPYASLLALVGGIMMAISACLNATLRAAKPRPPPERERWDGITERRRGNLPGKSLDYLYRGPERRKKAP
jgi:hypothetical protein